LYHYKHLVLIKAQYGSLGKLLYVACHASCMYNVYYSTLV